MFSNISAFGGKKVVDYDPESPLKPQDFCYRIRVLDRGEDFGELFTQFAREPAARDIEEFVVGRWSMDVGEPSDEAVEVVSDCADQLPSVRAIMFGDLSQEESETSWVENSDMGPLFRAFPNLETFHCRGGNGLRFRGVTGDSLQELVVEAGGLHREAVVDLVDAAASLPALEVLDLWLGSSEFVGRTADWNDLSPVFYGGVFGSLRKLGLQNAENIVELVGYLVGPPQLTASTLSGCRVGVTGGFEREGVRKELSELGATVQNDFSLDVDYLVLGTGGRQGREAFYFGVPVLFEEDVEALLEEGRTTRQPAPIVEQLKELDLSRGVLGDEGFDLLTRHPALGDLEQLTVHDHYGVEGWSEALDRLGISSDLTMGWRIAGPYDRFVAISE